MFQDLLHDLPKSLVVGGVVWAGASWLAAQEIAHRMGEREALACMDGKRSLARSPTAEDVLRDVGQQVLRNYGANGLWSELLGTLTVKHHADMERSRDEHCRCLSNAAIGDARLSYQTWVWVASLRLTRTPDMPAVMARMDQQNVCGGSSQ